MTNRIRVKHIHDCNGRITATIATHEQTPDTLLVSIARCNPKETSPTRQLGRTIATGRMEAYLSGRTNTSNVVTMKREVFLCWLQVTKALEQMKPDFETISSNVQKLATSVASTNTELLLKT